jgi:hypothetical protein
MMTPHTSRKWAFCQVWGILVYWLYAGVVKLADTPALGAGTRKGVQVQFLSPAPGNSELTEGLKFTKIY